MARCPDTKSTSWPLVCVQENEENVVPMDTSPPCKVSSQGPAVTTGKASNRISALAEQVFGPGGGNKVRWQESLQS